MELQALGDPPRFGWLEDVVQRTQLVSVEIVQHQPYRFCMRVCLVCQPPHLMCEVHSSATLGHLDMPPASFRLTEHEQVSGPVSLVLVVILFHSTRPGPDGRFLVGHQLLGRLIETDHGMVGVVVFMVQVQHILHSSHELPAHLRDAPFLLRPRLEFVFLSVWRTVSREMLSANPIWTTLSASSCSVQCVCPSGASLQAMATRCASCLPSNLRLCPGRGRSISALSSPSCTNCVRTRPTVEALINSPLAMSRSIRPSFAFSNTSAHLTLPRIHRRTPMDGVRKAEGG